ncbi:ABC transporter permease [Candidatus Oleimmundimicrobium sp.]|uniref:ABC transporter permease n=1 Tax=Candidatus Oleimmundimicrobium sp. TaxID=3060597 RepID=UPI0027220B19|nr:ABC transporter permease [Candidatus Oleimmundimicrobium sp.]MDO8885959.1 ABC transporter permease [Candidatus Oleimmundimicrobium sp.]
MGQLRYVWLIAKKDIKLFFTDRLVLFFFVLFPFLFIIMFNFMQSGVGAEDERLVLHLATQEAKGGISHQIIEAMETQDEAKLKPGEPEIVWEKDYNKAHQKVEDKKLDGFLSFPKNFTEGLMMGYGAQLEVVADAEAVNTIAALNGLAQVIGSRVGSQQVVTNASIGLLIEEQMSASGDMANIGQAFQQPFLIQQDTVLEDTFIDFGVEKVGEVEPFNVNDYTVPGYLVMFVFFAAALSATMIVRERQNNTMERLLTGSASRESIIGGIFAGTAAKGLIQIFIFWTVGILVLHVDIGLAPAAVIILSVLMVIMSSAFSIMLATLVKTERSADSIAVLTSLVLAPLGGCWWPLFITPKWMQALAKITPHGWATTGFNKLILFGAEFNAVIPEMLALIGFAVVFGIIAIWRFRTSAV